jgi:hypothetical protein
VPGFWRIVLVIATSATGAGIAGLHAQTALMDPKDSKAIFATTCTACHKSPQGLAKSGQVAGFLRQHYTTGPEMSAAMAAYLVAAGAAPAPKQKAEKKDAAEAKAKSKKQEQAEQAALTQPGADAKDRNIRGKQRETKQGEASSPARPSPMPPDQPASITAPEPVRQAAAPAAATPAAAAPAVSAPAAAPAPAEPLVTFDLPLPPMPDGPPADLTNQTGFSSSPVP